MPVDFGLAASQGINAAVQGQDPTIQANLKNVPGYQNQIDFYKNNLTNGPNQQQMGDWFNQQNAQNSLRGQSASPAAIFQNVLGYNDYANNFKTQGAQGLQNITQGSQLQAFQPGQGVQGALQANMQNSQEAQQTDMMSRQKGTGQYGLSTLNQLGGMAMAGGGQDYLNSIMQAGFQAATPAMGFGALFA